MNSDKLLFHLKYPKLYVLILSIIISSIIYTDPNLVQEMFTFGYGNALVMFFSGMVFALGFISPFAAGFWIITSQPDTILASVISALGAVVIDVIVFRYIMRPIKEEAKDGGRGQIAHALKVASAHRTGRAVMIFISVGLAGFLTSLPLPQNAGKIIVKELTKANWKKIAIASFVLNFIVTLFFLNVGFLVKFVFGILGI